MNPNLKTSLPDFVKFCQEELHIENLPSIKLIGDKNWVAEYRSFGEYDPLGKTIKIYHLGRNTADVLRSLAHELTHHRQAELGMIKAGDGNTGSDIENDANAMAGVIMRDYGKRNAKIYDLNV